MNAEKILEDYDSVLKEQIARELEDMKEKVDAAQSQLTLAEMVRMELDPFFCIKIFLFHLDGFELTLAECQSIT